MALKNNFKESPPFGLPPKTNFAEKGGGFLMAAERPIFCASRPLLQTSTDTHSLAGHCPAMHTQFVSAPIVVSRRSVCAHVLHLEDLARPTYSEKDAHTERRDTTVGAETNCLYIAGQWPAKLCVSVDVYNKGLERGCDLSTR